MKRNIWLRFWNLLSNKDKENFHIDELAKVNYLVDEAIQKQVHSFTTRAILDYARLSRQLDLRNIDGEQLKEMILDRIARWEEAGIIRYDDERDDFLILKDPIRNKPDNPTTE